ncbi:hypothetical protein [Kitasatospora sp. NPDC092286]|uniref:hypothetical protein n=1 Tax=Kitasatospora sp. NPDC092286 TaxID=3364087 RepID=UPI00380E2E57
MIRRTGRLLGAVATTLALAFGGLGVAAAPAVAAPLPIEQCTTTSGVVLAVDFGKWGGPLLRSCGTTPTTGYTLLNQGGWKTTGTGHDGPAFICRIGYSGYQGGKQFPTPDQEKCVLTPPATAYWSYWHADPGENTWSYSQLGAMSYRPKPGSVDLWIFGGTNIEGTEGRPAFSPDTVRAHNTAPGGGADATPEPPRPPAGAGSAGGSGSGSGSGGGGTAGGSGGGTGGTSGGSASGGSVTGGTGGGGTKRPPAAGTPGGTGRTEPAIPPAGLPEQTTPAPDPAASVPAPDETPAQVPSDTPSATDTAPPPSTDPATPAPSADAGGPAVVNAAPVADAPHDAGPIAPVVAGVVLVAALGTATVIAARRRRRAE